MQRFKSFLVVCISILTGNFCVAQSNYPVVDKIIPDSFTRPHAKPLYGPAITPAPSFSMQSAQVAGPDYGTYQSFGSAYYISHLGFFCRKEIEFEKTAHIPLHFRLGDMQYVNHLEGK